MPGYCKKWPALCAGPMVFSSCRRIWHLKESSFAVAEQIHFWKAYFLGCLACVAQIVGDRSTHFGAFGKPLPETEDTLSVKMAGSCC